MAADAFECPGYEASNPVRVGNVARERFALGIVGEVVDHRCGSHHGNVQRAVEAQLAEALDVITDNIRGAHAAVWLSITHAAAAGGRTGGPRGPLWFSCPVNGWFTGAAERLCAARRQEGR
jgi:hypothetical protein